LAEKYADYEGATTFYLGAKGPEAGVMVFSTYFNPKLALHSDYFEKMNAMMQCVEKHAATAKNQDLTCANEFK
jgi:hypothetical protein